VAEWEYMATQLGRGQKVEGDLDSLQLGRDIMAMAE